MNIHYDNYLVRKYPLLYRNRYASPKTTSMVWGFSCGDGWFNIINALSAELSHPYERAKSRYEFMVENKKSPELISEAVNEMNLLREHHPVAMQVKEKFGALRFYADNISADQDKYIAFAENMSARTCEVCGKRGKLRTGGWLQTLCNEHYINRGNNE